MSGYDSESSSDEDQQFSTTNVTLGYGIEEPVGDEISHIGGYPTWLNANHLPPATLAKCKVCNGFMSLLLQLNADLLQYFPNDERRLHVLCCRKKQCSKKKGSVRAFREIKKGQAVGSRAKNNEKPSIKDQQAPIRALGDQLFGSANTATTSTNDNPFSKADTTTAASLNPFATLSSPSILAAKPPQTPIEPPTESFADKLKIENETSTSPKSPEQMQEPWPSQSLFPSPHPSLYLDASPEELDFEKPADPAAESSNIRYDTDDGPSGAIDKESFESALDKTFQKFSDRIAQNPDQVLRYEFKGQPLLYSGTDGVASRFVLLHGKVGAVKGIPRCESCGSQRVFELQLVPGLIYELEKEQTMDLDDGMEWGTIIVGTCMNNCGDPGMINFKEEWVGVQWEERVMRK